MLAATGFGRQPYVCVACVGVAFGLSGAVTQTAYENLLELVPRHHGAMFALVSCVAGGTGVLSPLAVAFLTGSDSVRISERLVGSSVPAG